MATARPTSRRLTSDREPVEWIDDETIDAFLKACTVTYKHTVAFKAASFAYLLDELTNSTNPNTALFFHGVDLQAATVIFIPVNTNGHWVLLVANRKTSRMELFDSSLTTGWFTNKFMNAFKFISEFLLSHDGPWKELKSLPFHAVRNIPQQIDANSCGVFVCVFARCYAENDGFDIEVARDSPDLRSFINKAIKDGSIDRGEWFRRRKPVEDIGTVIGQDLVFHQSRHLSEILMGCTKNEKFAEKVQECSLKFLVIVQDWLLKCGFYENTLVLDRAHDSPDMQACKYELRELCEKNRKRREDSQLTANYYFGVGITAAAIEQWNLMDSACRLFMDLNVDYDKVIGSIQRDRYVDMFRSHFIFLRAQDGHVFF